MHCCEGGFAKKCLAWLPAVCKSPCGDGNKQQSGIRAACTEGAFLGDLELIVQNLVTSGGSPWLTQRPVSDCFHDICAESDKTLLVLKELRDRKVAVLIPRLQRKLVDRLGTLLVACLLAAFKTASEHDLAISAAYDTAVNKVQWRTPYMSEWGDGSIAATATEAEAFWQKRKKMKNPKSSPSNGAVSAWQHFDTKASHGTSRDRLLDVVKKLVAPHGCLWTATKRAEELLTFLKSECAEVMEELALISRSAPQVAKDRRPSLASELGDVFFTVFMAILVAARDHDVDPAAVDGSAMATLNKAMQHPVLLWGVHC